MPASEALLCLFISSHGASHVGHGTLTNWITGLELWHSINGAPWLGKKHLACPIKGAASAAPSPSSRLPCLPILISHLQMLHGALDLANTFDALVDAIVCIGFWSQCRLVELCLDAPFDPQHHASRSSVRKSNMASNRVTYSGFFAPYMKIKPCGDWIYWTCSGCICSANKAFINHLEANSDLPMNAPLFAFETGPASWEPMWWSWLMECCNEISLGNSSALLTGHSFRTRGTTHLLLLGMDPFIIMVQGHWKSNAFLAYWHHCEEILPLFIGSALPSSSSILDMMNIFKHKILGIQ